MNRENLFINRIRSGKICLGTAIAFKDSVATEALAIQGAFDSFWIDTEHLPMTLETVERHVMATKGTDVTPLVRVAANDPVLIKPILDIGVPGVIVPLVRTAEDVQGAIAACLYPPDGVRGFGPRRPPYSLNYGDVGGPEFCRRANEEMITIVQIEHVDAVDNLDDILAVPGLSGVVIGPNDLSASMGYVGEPRHKAVLDTIDMIIDKTKTAPPFVGIAAGYDPDVHIEWMIKGVQWLVMGGDVDLMLCGAQHVTSSVRERSKSIQ